MHLGNICIYLKSFQKNLRDSIEKLIYLDWEYTELLLTEEDGNIPGAFNGYMDISISNPSRENIIFGIEIEHISDCYQAKHNIEKLKKWSHNSVKRNASLLLIFNEVCNISCNKIGELVKYAKEIEHKNHGFYYD